MIHASRVSEYSLCPVYCVVTNDDTIHWNFGRKEKASVNCAGIFESRLVGRTEIVGAGC